MDMAAGQSRIRRYRLVVGVHAARLFRRRRLRYPAPSVIGVTQHEPPSPRAMDSRAGRALF